MIFMIIMLHRIVEAADKMHIYVDGRSWNLHTFRGHKLQNFTK